MLPAIEEKVQIIFAPHLPRHLGPVLFHTAEVSLGFVLITAIAEECLV